MRIRKLVIIIVLVLLWVPFSLWADVRLSSVFTHNMVLQRGVNAAVFGFAEDGEKVTVSINNQKAKTTAKNGRWLVRLKPMKAGGPYKLTIDGNNKIVLNNVMIGDVWLCGGQSNMDWDMSKLTSDRAGGSMTKIYKRIIAESDKYPNLRMILFDKKIIYPAADDMTVSKKSGFKGSWQPSSPLITKSISAVGYVFGLKLLQHLNIPIGLIDANKSGSKVEVWMSPEALRSVGADPKAKTYYNGMISPLIPFAIKGVIWYQGESNSKQALEYENRFKAFITSWRKEWGLGDFPFLFVQLAGYARQLVKNFTWPLLRESQTKALTLPNTGMAVTIDIGEEENIHPFNKIDVSGRLFAAARHVAYGEDIVYSGPIYKDMKIEGNKVIISFDHIGSGLIAREITIGENELKSSSLQGFVICNDDKKFIPARARIKGNTIVLSSPKITNPIAVRYAWTGFPIANLGNKEEFPASPFRTDQFEIKYDLEAMNKYGKLILPPVLERMVLTTDKQKKVTEIHSRYITRDLKVKTRKFNKIIKRAKNFSGKKSERYKKAQKEKNDFLKPFFNKIIADVLDADFLSEEEKEKVRKAGKQ